MTPEEFNTGLKDIEKAFPGSSFPEASIASWYPRLKDVSREDFRKAINMIIENTESLWPGTNMVAVIRKYVSPLLTENTISDHLFYAVSLAKGRGENPYSYLKRLDKELCEMADRMGLFAADVSSESLRFMVRDVAKAWIERRENLKRGFETPRSEPQKMISAPLKTLVDLTPEQRQANILRIQEITKGIGARRIGGQQ